MLHKLLLNDLRSKPLNEVSHSVTFAFPSDILRVFPNLNAILAIFSGLTDQEASARRSDTTEVGGLPAAVAVWCLLDLDGHSVWFAATSGTNVCNEVTLGSRSASDFQARSLPLYLYHTRMKLQRKSHGIQSNVNENEALKIHTDRDGPH